MLMQSFTVTFRISLENMVDFRNTMLLFFNSYLREIAFLVLFSYENLCMPCPSHNQVSPIFTRIKVGCINQREGLGLFLLQPNYCRSPKLH